MTEVVSLLAPVLSLGVKAVATGAFVLGIAVLIERAPQPVAAASIGLPVVIGPGFLFLALQQPTAFLEAAATTAILGLVATLAFMVVTGRLFQVLGPAPLLACGAGAWALVALLITETSFGLGTALIAFAGAFATSHLILPFSAGVVPAPARPVPRRGPPFDRAIQAGLFVAAISYGADRLGERLTAVLLAMPVALMFLTLTLKTRVDGATAAHVFQWARMGLLPLVGFVLTIRLTATAVGNVPSVLVAFGSSILLAATIAAAREFLSRWTAQSTDDPG